MFVICKYFIDTFNAISIGNSGTLAQKVSIAKTANLAIS